MISEAPLNGSKFMCRANFATAHPNQPRLIERLHYCSPVGLMNRETRHFHSLTWENHRDESRLWSPHFGNLRYARAAMRVARAYTYGYIRTFDGLIDRPIAPYLFIFHRVLAPGTISSFSFHCVRTRGGKNMKSPRLPFPRAWHSINFFFS